MFLTGQAIGGDWPQWRGPERTGHAPSGLPELTRLPKEPMALWRIKIGGGHSGPIVAGGKVAYLDENGQESVAHLIDADTGKEIWSAPFAEAYKDEWGAGPRSTPIADGDRLYAQSCMGEFACLSMADGKILWRINFGADFGAVFIGQTGPEIGAAIRRGNNGSGIVNGDTIIVPVGSTNGAALVCFDKRIGKMIWKSQNDYMAYSSLVAATLGGIKQVVAFTAEALIGVEMDTGKLLWRAPLRSFANRHVLTPVIADDNVVVGSLSLGLVSIKIAATDGNLQASEAWVNRQTKINLATPVLVGRCLFGLGATKNYVCLDVETGEVLWSQPGFGGYASTIAIGKQLLVLTDLGEIILIAAEPDRYHELGRAQVCGKTWAFPAYANGRLYARDASELACFDLTIQD